MVTPEVFDVTEFWKTMEGLDRGFAVAPRRQTAMIIVLKPAANYFL